MNKFAPIALFVYNRKDHLEQTIYSLLKNNHSSDSDLFIFSDGPKSEDAIDKVKKVREFIHKLTGFNKIEIIERTENYGLANSIISGVTEIVSNYGKVIVLEDDIVTSRYFLYYMNSYLDLYEREEEVISIHGYIYPVKRKLPNTFFIKGADCWGWATWKRGWDLFESDGKKLLDELEKRRLSYYFDFDGTFGYSTMLKEQITGRNNSWAIRWNASAFLKNKLTLYPGISLVQNIGNDSSGTHCGDNTHYLTEVNNENLLIQKITLTENLEAREIMKEYFQELSGLQNLDPKDSLPPTPSCIRKLKESILLPIKVFIKKIIAYKISKINKKSPDFVDENKFYGWSGDFTSWDDVLKICDSYSNKLILEKVKNSLLKVKSNEAVYERDSVVFNKKEYSWPLLATIMMVAAKNKGEINVLDFGGSLGSTYFQNLEFLQKLSKFKWNIVEQEEFVLEGIKLFENENLKFHFNIGDSIAKDKINLLIFSSVLQYLSDPYKLIKEDILPLKIPYIVIDLTGIIDRKKDRLTIQRVPPSIYEASYPCRFFNEENLKRLFINDYNLIESFPGYVGSVLYLNDGTEVNYKGYIFELK